MKVYDIEVHGIKRALRGLARSYNSDSSKMLSRAIKLGPLDKGHNKFLRQIQVWCEVEAPRYWWQEYDTYQIGTVRQSDSTMHTLHKGEFTQDNFQYPIFEETLWRLNRLRALFLEGTIDIECFKNELPEGFLQGRTLTLNYAVIRNIVLQRYNHRISRWQELCSELLTKLPNIELLGIPTEILVKLEIKLFHTNEK